MYIQNMYVCIYYVCVLCVCVCVCVCVCGGHVPYRDSKLTRMLQGCCYMSASSY